jgi:outer membrane protein OmpA-like peptidoglycan-associated protein
VRSGTGALGNDTDVGVHFGGGLKLFVHDYIALRLEGRDTVGAGRGVPDGTNTTASLSHYGEFVFGLSVTPRLARHSQSTEPSRHVSHRTTERARIDEEADVDGDGISGSADACPTERGVAPTGCPVLDRDRDGIEDRDDDCSDAAEVANGYRDGDGCPDELPTDLRAIVGTISGVSFVSGSAELRPPGIVDLREIAAVLKRYPDVRVEVVAHSDDTGPAATNVSLSRQRAETVRAQLVGEGVSALRIHARGAGPFTPIADNTTKKGRAKNRRVELKLLADSDGAP